MKQKITLFISICIALISCKENKEPIPLNTMKKIILDLQIAQEFVLDQKSKDSSINLIKKTDSIFNTIMFTYGINKHRFLESYNYYEKKPLLLNELLDSTSSYAQKKRDTIVNKLVPTSAPPKK